MITGRKMTYLVDSHCHLASLSLEGKAGDSVEKIIKRANLAGVSHFLAIACTNAEFIKTKEIAKDYDNIYLACGLHPLNLEEDPDWKEESLVENVNSSNKVIAVGEVGLDYHYAEDSKDLQKQTFARQIQVAHTVKKPLVVHAREAHHDTVEILRGENARDVGGIIHSFTDSVQMARECLDLGFYISFNGISTFKASDNVREVVKYVPNDRIMVETDCPYLAPIPVRGIENEPAFVRYTLKFLADFKGMSEDALARITSENFQKLYNVTLADIKVPQVECSTYKIDGVVNLPFRE